MLRQRTYMYIIALFILFGLLHYFAASWYQKYRVLLSIEVKSIDEHSAESKEKHFLGEYQCWYSILCKVTTKTRSHKTVLVCFLYDICLSHGFDMKPFFTLNLLGRARQNLKYEALNLPIHSGTRKKSF